MHISVPVEATVELLNFTPVNPLISKCQIKVCYVGEDPNRNHSVITKDVAKDMAKSLPGCPIVGFFNESKGDFEEHNRMIDVSNGKFEIIDTTRPYGFVDLGAKVWFQKFLDDGVEHEYLMTEGYIWDDVYPEAKRIVEKGNNQSMELHNKLTKGKWTTDDNGMPQFFIINEAIIQKLCILGENVEPCFEGAGIATEFSIDGEFKERLFSMIKELQTALQEGGNAQMNEDIKTPMTEEEQNIENPAEETEFKKKPDEEEEKKEEKKPPFPPKKDEDDSEDKNDSEESEEDEDEDADKKKKGKKKFAKSDDEEDDDEDKKCPKCGKKASECSCNKEKKYNLEEIPEYVELAKNYAALEVKIAGLEQEIAPLREFKATADRKEKQAMIDGFYMLSDEDKMDVVTNIDKYSLDDIEAKLSIICVRNKVNFSLDDDKKETETKDPMVYSLGDDDGNDNAPAWIKAVRETAKTM